MKKIVYIGLAAFVSLSVCAEDINLLYKIVETNSANLRIREGPDLQSPVIALLKDHERVYVHERTNEQQQIGVMNEYWYQVETLDGTIGWSYGYYLDRKRAYECARIDNPDGITETYYIHGITIDTCTFGGTHSFNCFLDTKAEIAGNYIVFSRSDGTPSGTWIFQYYNMRVMRIDANTYEYHLYTDGWNMAVVELDFNDSELFITGKENSDDAQREYSLVYESNHKGQVNISSDGLEGEYVNTSGEDLVMFDTPNGTKLGTVKQWNINSFSCYEKRGIKANDYTQLWAYYPELDRSELKSFEIQYLNLDETMLSQEQIWAKVKYFYFIGYVNVDIGKLVSREQFLGCLEERVNPR